MLRSCFGVRNSLVTNHFHVRISHEYGCQDRSHTWLGGLCMFMTPFSVALATMKNQLLVVRLTWCILSDLGSKTLFYTSRMAQWHVASLHYQDATTLLWRASSSMVTAVTRTADGEKLVTGQAGLGSANPSRDKIRTLSKSWSRPRQAKCHPNFPAFLADRFGAGKGNMAQCEKFGNSKI